MTPYLIELNPSCMTKQAQDKEIPSQCKETLGKENEALQNKKKPAERTKTKQNEKESLPM
jgi:hypothetical protein